MQNVVDFLCEVVVYEGEGSATFFIGYNGRRGVIVEDGVSDLGTMGSTKTRTYTVQRCATPAIEELVVASKIFLTIDVVCFEALWSFGSLPCSSFCSSRLGSIEEQVNYNR